jgi:hypothetical protein
MRSPFFVCQTDRTLLENSRMWRTAAAALKRERGDCVCPKSSLNMPHPMLQLGFAISFVSSAQLALGKRSVSRRRYAEYVASKILEVAVHQNYSRYRSREFERRWRARLKAPEQRATSHLHVVVTHRFPAPNRYGWELRPSTGLSVEESPVQFASWEEASQAGKLALKQFSIEG